MSEIEDRAKIVGGDYLSDCKSAGAVTGGVLWISEGSYDRIRRKYSRLGGVKKLATHVMDSALIQKHPNLLTPKGK